MSQPTDAETRKILAAAAERVRALKIREPLDDVDHHVNDVLEQAARAVTVSGTR
ncbi:hypothetical protein [Kitasatospora sp. NPDC087314]|uniref:hypothetical protein n=1 Tax=Kitasatospora sp. NPDC087314 TaxID=3364068 RepID=UPI0037F272F6